MLFDEYLARRAPEAPDQGSGSDVDARLGLGLGLGLGPGGSPSLGPSSSPSPGSGSGHAVASAADPRLSARRAPATARALAPARPGGGEGAGEGEGEGVRHFPSSGVAVRGPFLAFYEHFGPTICGLPLTDASMFEGRRIQVFERMVLEEHALGRVRPRALGAEWLAHVMVEDSESIPDRDGQLRIIDIVDRLPHAPDVQAYARRPLADIRYLVIHHTGASADIGPEAIAREHVEGLGWPGIGYHFVIGADGSVWRTQDLTTVSHHARQFNAVSVGIALTGDLLDAVPPAAQIEAAAGLAAWLLDQLGLPISSVRGHRELVETRCPGEPFLSVWRPRLIEAVKARAGHVGRSAAHEHA